MTEKTKVPLTLEELPINPELDLIVINCLSQFKEIKDDKIPD